MSKIKTDIHGPILPRRGRGRPRKHPLKNSALSDTLLGPGIGGGINPIGFPYNQGAYGTAPVEQVNTAFVNLRWYLVSNFQQFLNQLYSEIGLVQTICDLPVDDGLRGGIEVKTKELEESELAELMNVLDRDNDIQKAAQAAKWNRLFGGAGIIIVTNQDPAKPFDITKIGPNDKVEFRPADMWELYYDAQNTEGYNPTVDLSDGNDDSGPLDDEFDFDYYSYYGTRIHKSRVIKLEGITPPSYIRPRLRGWGLSVVEILIRSINQYLKSTSLAFEVLDEYKIDVYKIKGLVQALFSPGGQSKIQERIAVANLQKNYMNALVIDSEDEWDHKQISFTGIAEAMAEIRMQVAADLRMPLTKIFGISAAGFNSGEDDIEVYNGMVESQVRNKIKYAIMRMVEIKCQMLFGFVPDDLRISFKPLREMSSEQEQNVKNGKFTNYLQALQGGAISISEFRDGINKSQIFDIVLEEGEASVLEEMAGYNADTISDGPNPDDDNDTDNPGEARDATKMTIAIEPGGAPISKDKPDRTQKEPAKGQPKKAATGDVKNGPFKFTFMPKPYSAKDHERRNSPLRNSALYDLKSYEADGGDDWIDDRKKEFYTNPLNLSDRGLWEQARQASIASTGKASWKFALWFYKKMGGKIGI